MYTRFIFMTSELAIRVSLILIRLILLLQISDIVDFIFIKQRISRVGLFTILTN